MDKRTCAHPDCGFVLTKNPGPGRWPKWCELHRLRAKTARDRARVEARRGSRVPLDRACPRCGAEFATLDVRRKWCSVKCRTAAGHDRNRGRNNARRRAEGRAEKQARDALGYECHGCGAKFHDRKRKYCSADCYPAAPDSRTRLCAMPDCDRPLRAKGMCSMHWKRDARRRGAVKNEPWTEARRARWMERKARKVGVDSERVIPLEVFERDGWVCGICDGPVDPSLDYPDPMSASLDHIVPLSRGGSHTYRNTQCSHLGCNVSKGAAAPLSA